MPGTESLRFAVRVRPGASRPKVGGAYGPTDGAAPQLVVAVSSPAVAGAASAAVLDAIAKAFKVRPMDVRLVSGSTSRTKVVAVQGDPTVLRARLTALLDGAAV
jgi:uncharacterized protein YggU (UPF0235/DUF167 family)